ncbi:hypothetical protein KAH27_03605 [bacterium]|nr:hypothetical protein [bacterium]
MRIEFDNQKNNAITPITIGEFQKVTLSCLIDTGFSGYLAGFLSSNNSTVKHASLGNIDYIKEPISLPNNQWVILANGSTIETWRGIVLCELNNFVKECPIILFSVAKPQPIPLILGMSLLKAYKADLSIHFSSNTFSLNI